jgi:hypothetical protein
MTDQQFWDVIDAADFDIDELVTILTDLPPEMVVAFENHVRRRIVQLHREDVWGAAYLIKGGCTDDAFDGFRGWLIGKGREVFEKALENPDSLADLGAIDDDADWPLLFGAADEAYEERHGKPIAEAKGVEPVAFPEMGSSLDFDNEKAMRKRYPKLFAVYIDAA